MAMVQEARDFDTLRAELEARTSELQSEEGGRHGEPEKARHTPGFEGASRDRGDEPCEAHEHPLAAPVGPETAGSESFLTLEEVEREYIVRVLKARNWRISGPRGAARDLGLNASTLRSRMKKLGIVRDISRNR
jgi:transcriptional regulator with GAF, ATPase, and Fis domain